MCTDEKKLISVVVPVYNEILSLDELYARTSAVMQGLAAYEYEIVFFDDGSSDGSRAKIEALAAADARVKAVFYSKNYGYSKNIFYCIQQARGDCAVLLHADLQNPPELIPEFVAKWEAGAKSVLGIKNKSRENKFMFFMRTVFYWIMNRIFGMRLIPHATEFELLDKSFIDVLKQSNYKNPFLRGIIAEYGCDFDYVYYTQDRRRAGKSKFSVNKYYDFAICGIVNMSRKFPRRMLCVGLVCILICALEFFCGFLPRWIAGGVADVAVSLFVRAIFLLLSVQLSFVSVIAEYVLSIAGGMDSKPLITEEKRIRY